MLVGAACAEEAAPLDPPTTSSLELIDLPAEFQRRFDIDQRARTLTVEQQEELDEAKLEELQQVDRDNTAWMKAVIARHGWPGVSLVGAKASHQAWLLVQHADLDRAFQERCLALMEDAPPGDVKPANLAYLEDRIAVGEGRPQRYGTQLRTVGERLVPQPLVDEANVDALRAEVDLPPLAEYLERANRFYRTEP
ncbi:MAG: DUF6624 domain-containing protein [Planctomycetota bacterium]